MPATYDPYKQRLSDEGLSVFRLSPGRGTTSSQPSRRQVENLVRVRVRPDRTDMDIGSIETSDPGQKPVLRTLGQFVRLGDGEARVSRDVGFGPKPVPNPADAQLPDLLDAFYGDKGLGGLIDERGINGIHQRRTYLRDR
jgi:hypothetical protein